MVSPEVSHDSISDRQGQSPPARPDPNDINVSQDNPSNSKPASLSTSEQPTMPIAEDVEALVDADNEAVDSIEVGKSLCGALLMISIFLRVFLMLTNTQQGGQWRVVHEHWSRRTGRNLSPASFGKRIQAVQPIRRAQLGRTHSPALHRLSGSQQVQVPQTLSLPARQHRSSDSRGMVNGGQAHSGPGSPSHARSPMDNPQVQRADINRIDGAVGRLQMDMRALRAAVDALRHDMRQRRGSNDETDPNTLDALSDSVAKATAKTGEIDGIKIQIDQLKRRLKRVEEGSGNPPTPPQPDTSQMPSMTQSNVTLPPPPPSAPQRHAPVVPPPPVEPVPGGWNAVNSIKRKSPPEAEEYDPQTGAKRLKPAVPSPQPFVENLTRSGHDTPRLAPIRTFNPPETHEWQPPTLPAIRSAGYGARRPGRPPKPPPENLGTPPWEREGWNGPEADSEGYYRPIGTVPPSPSALDRGRLVRRGSASGIQYMDHAAVAKKTRQKPIRNSEGVLIRKDGKPDQRSISSPMNLKKVHARKLAEAESTGTRRDSISNPTSPLAISETGAQNEEDEEEDETSPESASRNQGKDRHRIIMQQMFPHGVADDTNRMNHASELLSPSEASHVRVQTKDELMRDDAHSSVDSSRRTSDNTTVAGTPGDLQSSEPSHSKYYARPSSRGPPRESSPQKGSVAVERSGGDVQMTAALSRSSDPTMAQVSGSLYQPSENSETPVSASTYQPNTIAGDSMPPPAIKVSAQQQQPGAETTPQDSGSVYEPSQDTEEASLRDREVVEETQFEPPSDARVKEPDTNIVFSYQPSSTNTS